MKVGPESSQTLTLYSSRLKYFFVLLISLAFTFVGTWMLKEGDAKGWLVLIFFGLLCLMALAPFLCPRRFYLHLSPEGFEARSLFHKTFTRWRDASRFEVRWLVFTKLVVFNYGPAHHSYEWIKKANRMVGDFEGGLPDTYGLSADELVRLLNEWRERYRNK